MPIRRQKRKKTEVKDIMPNLEEPKNQILEWWKHIQENLYLYLFSILFILFCIIVGGAYGLYKSSKNQDIMTQYARAVLKEDLNEKLEGLKPLLDVQSSLLPEIMYVYGETAFQLGKIDEAESVWKKLCERYPQSEWTPNAKEGLGYIEELRKNYDNAIGIYKEIKEKWPGSFIAKRQSFNIARVYEAKEDWATAIEHYKNQEQEFPESSVARKAKSALDRLKQDHPDLFPEEKKEEEAKTEGGEGSGGEKQEGERSSSNTAEISTSVSQEQTTSSEQ